MTKRVIDVGQCNPDHAAIRRLLEQNFPGVVVLRTHELTDTLEEARKHRPALVLINRKLDFDYSDGMEVLTALKADEDLGDIPVMLVTNYPEFQEAAVNAGAVSGFGKNELQSPLTLQKLKPYLEGK